MSDRKEGWANFPSLIRAHYVARDGKIACGEKVEEAPRWRGEQGMGEVVGDDRCGHCWKRVRGSVVEGASS